MKRHFTLIELLVVVAIIGIVFLIMVPQYGGVQQDALEQTNAANMNRIREAFTRFVSESGIVNDIDKLEDITAYGLWPMIALEHPNTELRNNVKYRYPLFDPQLGIGRRMGYVGTSGTRSIVKPANTVATAGQVMIDQGGIEVPVIPEPYGNYYRVMVPLAKANENDYRKLIRLKHMVLVSPGPNGVLDITPDDFNKDTGEIETDGSGKVLSRQVDDIVIRLMPNVPYFTDNL